MKHIKALGCQAPAKGAAAQDIICMVVTTLNAILGSFGGASPIGGYVVDKCTIPVPNDGAGDGADL